MVQHSIETVLVFHHFASGLAHPACLFWLVDRFYDACSESFGIVHRKNASRNAIQNDFRYATTVTAYHRCAAGERLQTDLWHPLMLERMNA